jgi:hypothetical protein
MISRSALLAATARLALAQTGPSVDGSVVNRAIGDGIPGATVTLFDRGTTQYQAVTDSSGAFRVASASPGQYQAMVEKDGFVVFQPGPIQISTGNQPVHLQYALQFGSTQQARLGGQVLDSKDRPLANAQVDLIVGPSLRHTTTANADGRFAFEKLAAGAYELRAAPPADHPGEDVATYFPSSIDQSGAQRIEVRGNASIDGFRLRTAPVFHVRGVVVDESGNPAAQVTVRLVPTATQPAHVFLSIDPVFFVTSKNPGAGPGSQHVATGADGHFEFPSVRSGAWNIVVEAALRIDPKSGFNLAPSKVTSAYVGDQDLQVPQILLDRQFALAGSAQWPVAQYFHVPPQGPLDAPRQAPEGIAYPIWFGAVDGQTGFLSVAVTQADANFSVDHVRPGRYLIQPLAALANPAGAPAGHMGGSSWPGVRGNTRRNRGAADIEDSVEIGSSSGPFGLLGGGWFDADEKHVPYPPLVLGPGSVRGTVENGAGAAVVLLDYSFEGPRSSRQLRSSGQLVFCKPDGSFEARGVFAGKYYIAAFRGLDFESLRDPEILQRLPSTGSTVEVQSGATTEIQLAASPLFE